MKKVLKDIALTLGATMLTFAAIHMAMLYAHAFLTGDFYHTNVLTILDPKLLFPNLNYTPMEYIAANIFEVGLMVVYFVIIRRLDIGKK